jgi:phosphatidylserine/phosphatidylglycerophosphate/cardiolipin synthase-like enzyme
MTTLPDGRIFYFAPEDSTIQPIIDLVSNATKSIYIWDYSFNLVPLVDILIEKFKAGVDVYLTLDKSQSVGSTEAPEVTACREAGIPIVIGTSDLHQILHDKVVIVDGSQVLYGSFNLTGAAAKEVNNYCIDPEIAVVNIYWQSGVLVTNWCIANQPTGVSNNAQPLVI